MTEPVVRLGSQRRPRYVPVTHEPGKSHFTCRETMPSSFTTGCRLSDGHDGKHTALIGENLAAQWNTGDKKYTIDRIQK